MNSCKVVFFAMTFHSNGARSTWVWYCSVGCGGVEPGEEEDEEEAGLRGGAEGQGRRGAGAPSLVILQAEAARGLTHF